MVVVPFVDGKLTQNVKLQGKIIPSPRHESKDEIIIQVSGGAHEVRLIY